MSSARGTTPSPTSPSCSRLRLQDPKASLGWNRKAADAGCVDAWLDLSDAYLNGDGIETDISEGKKWIIKAAEGNYALAQANLADMLLYDRRVEHDPGEALRWALKAADQGNQRGQATAAFIYGFGSKLKPSFPEDHVLGYMWYLIAQRPNEVFPQQVPMAHLKAKMTQEELISAENKAQEWRRQHNASP